MKPDESAISIRIQEATLSRMSNLLPTLPLSPSASTHDNDNAMGSSRLRAQKRYSLPPTPSGGNSILPIGGGSEAPDQRSTHHHNRPVDLSKFVRKKSRSPGQFKQSLVN